MRTYHFSCGNSTYGPIGLCARLKANNKAEAVTRLRRILEANVGPMGEVSISVSDPHVEYINVYISPEHIESSDVDGL